VCKGVAKVKQTIRSEKGPQKSGETESGNIVKGKKKNQNVKEGWLAEKEW